MASRKLADPHTERLRAAWEKFLLVPDHLRLADEARNIASSLSVSARDMEMFSLDLPELQKKSGIEYFDDHTGFFLSALINSGVEGRYVLHTANALPISNLCHLNTKDVEIIGHANTGLGWGMKGGQVRISGACGDLAGWSMEGGELIIEVGVFGEDGVGPSMKGGTIRVMGCVIGPVGDHMEGGEIHVHGSVLDGTNSAGIPKLGAAAQNLLDSLLGFGGIVGNRMTGGEIHLYGDFSCLGEVLGGEVYHRGTQIAGEPKA